jgi:predicted RNA binding protein YcfA (HicA-like mRNA interferase family)
MPKLPTIKAKKLHSILIKLGFMPQRQRGSHLLYYRESDHRSTTVPQHNYDIGRGLLHDIVHQIGLTDEEFLEYLSK